MLDNRLRIAALLAAAAVLAALAAIGPALVDVVAVGLVFVIGVALGRVLPRSLPRLLDSVRPWRMVAAGAAVAAAAAILLLPGLSDDDDEGSRDQQTATVPGAAPPAPAARELERRIGRAFVLEGARFRVFDPGPDEWAETIRRRPLGPRMRWVVLGVRATNLGRRRFNGNVLAYRLRADSRLIAPRFSGGTGPDSLVRTGRLARGASSLTRLGFEAPRDARELALVFEPRLGGADRVRVVLES